MPKEPSQNKVVAALLLGFQGQPSFPLWSYVHSQGYIWLLKYYLIYQYL